MYIEARHSDPIIFPNSSGHDDTRGAEAKLRKFLKQGAEILCVAALADVQAILGGENDGDGWEHDWSDLSLWVWLGLVEMLVGLSHGWVVVADGICVESMWVPACIHFNARLQYVFWLKTIDVPYRTNTVVWTFRCLMY